MVEDKVVHTAAMRGEGCTSTLGNVVNEEVAAYCSSEPNLKITQVVANQSVARLLATRVLNQFGKPTS